MRRVVGLIRRGAVIAIPTDTVYGLAAALDKPQALDRIYDIKGRPERKPLPVLLSSAGHIGKVASGVDEPTLALASRFWPGALTIVVPARPELPQQVVGVGPTGRRTVGVRLPAHESTIALIEQCGGAVVVTSANRSGEQPARTPDEVLTALGSDIDAIVDGGVAPNSLPSTVVAIEGDTLLILREGGVSNHSLELAWQEIRRAWR